MLQTNSSCCFVAFTRPVNSFSGHRRDPGQLCSDNTKTPPELRQSGRGTTNALLLGASLPYNTGHPPAGPRRRVWSKERGSRRVSRATAVGPWPALTAAAESAQVQRIAVALPAPSPRRQPPGFFLLPRASPGPGTRKALSTHLLKKQRFREI